MTDGNRQMNFVWITLVIIIINPDKESKAGARINPLFKTKSPQSVRTS